MSAPTVNPTIKAADVQTPAPSLARALVRSLTRGTAIAQGVRYIHVGHDQWLAAQHELLDEISEDGHSETKFVRGAYGAGKSHFLSVVQDGAREAGWMTSHIECKVDKVQIDRFETLYPNIAAKMLAQDILDARANGPDGLEVDAVRFVLERWTRTQLRAAGVKENALTKPFDAEDRLYRQFQAGLFKSNLPPDFSRALAGFARGFLVDDFETTNAVCGWLRGVAEKVRIPSAYLQKPNPGAKSSAVTELRPIGRGTAHDAMRGLLWLVRAAGYRGLALCIDEVEELAKLGNKRQDQALQALREYVDHAGGDGGYRYLCMYLAATPEMFEGEQYFPRYDALATRIQPLSPELNWRAPVVDLDRTPLEPGQMREMALRIWGVHRAAYGPLSTGELDPDFVSQLVTKIVNTKVRIAKPRLLARVMVDELERARQSGGKYAKPENLDEVVTKTAAQISREAEG
jgi:hypothetical protein